MVDYSKWDNLDVSDSDEETQPKTQAQTQKPTTTSSSNALTTTSKESHPDPPTQADDDAGSERPRLSPTLQEYANIHPTNYRASHEFLNTHPSLIDKATNSDGLLMKEAFLLALQLENTPEDELLYAKNKAAGKQQEERQPETEKKEIEEMVRQCVHQALLLQYCRLVSPDGKDQSAIGGFFMRLIMPEGYGGGKEKGKDKEEDGKARQRELLMGDVETRAKEIVELAKEARAEQLREHLRKMVEEK